MKNRIGKFRIEKSLLETDAQVIMCDVMARCIILRAEMLYECGSIEYVALSPDFEIIQIGECAPLYSVKITGRNAEFVKM